MAVYSKGEYCKGEYPKGEYSKGEYQRQISRNRRYLLYQICHLGVVSCWW